MVELNVDKSNHSQNFLYSNTVMQQDRELIFFMVFFQHLLYLACEIALLNSSTYSDLYTTASNNQMTTPSPTLARSRATKMPDEHWILTVKNTDQNSWFSLSPKLNGHNYCETVLS